MFNFLARAESMLTGGPWWWRPVGGAISLGILVAIYLALA